MPVMSDSAANASKYGESPQKTIVLVGMMGVGKTTVGRKLAEMLDIPFFDADQEIEKAANMSVSDIFSELGEASFRQGERRVIRRLLKGPRHVLATGGGAFIDEKTRQLVRETAISVWLQAEIDVILKRTGKRDTRPLLRQGDPRETLSRLLAEREPYYAEADIAIVSKDGPHKLTADRILDELAKLGQQD